MWIYIYFTGHQQRGSSRGPGWASPEDLCLPHKWRRWRCVRRWCVDCCWRDSGTWQLWKCCEGLSPADGHHLCHELELPTKNEVHFWSVSKTSSRAWCPKAVPENPVSAKQAYSLSARLTQELSFQTGH